MEHENYMRAALELAREADADGEVPGLEEKIKQKKQEAGR